MSRSAVGQRGFTMLELLVGVAAIGSIVLFGLGSMYMLTIRTFDVASSQASMQRVGSLAMETITRQAMRASPSPAPDANCIPGGVSGTSRTLLLRVTDTSGPNPPVGGYIPASQRGTYCYYAGNGTANAPAGALCQRLIADDGTTSACRNLLAAPQPDGGRVVRQTPLQLVRQTNPANSFCPRYTTSTAGAPVNLGVAVTNTDYCLAISQVAGTLQGDIAFAITDGLNTMTFTSSLMRRN